MVTKVDVNAGLQKIHNQDWATYTGMKLWYRKVTAPTNCMATQQITEGQSLSARAFHWMASTAADPAFQVKLARGQKSYHHSLFEAQFAHLPSDFSFQPVFFSFQFLASAFGLPTSPKSVLVLLKGL